jgi:hypothetical protein
VRLVTPGLFGTMPVKSLSRLRFENAGYKVENGNYVNIINERNAFRVAGLIDAIKIYYSRQGGSRPQGGDEITSADPGVGCAGDDCSGARPGCHFRDHRQ